MVKGSCFHVRKEGARAAERCQRDVQGKGMGGLEGEGSRKGGQRGGEKREKKTTYGKTEGRPGLAVERVRVRDRLHVRTSCEVCTVTCQSQISSRILLAAACRQGGKKVNHDGPR